MPDPAWRAPRRLPDPRSWLARRLRLLPADTPDGLGESTHLADTGLDADVIVFFPDTVDALYQLTPWYAALRSLHRARPTTIVVQDSRVAARVRAESGLSVTTIASADVLTRALARSTVRAALYVNHSPRNFRLLRFCSLAHVLVGHGDSDKTITVTNQTKAYDFLLVAGHAAIDRARANLPLFDTGRMITVGRPNLDAEALEQRAGEYPAQDREQEHRSAILYAPTWEGAQATASYSSVVSHGEPAIRTLLDEGYRIIYRPHPLTGVRLPAVGDADRRIRELLGTARDADPTADHRVDLEDVPLSTSMADADLLICDVSAMSVEWLPSGRPLVITVPDGASVEVAGTPLEQVVPRLDGANLASVADLVRRELQEDPSRDRRRALIEYYVGDTTPGASIEAFLAAES